MPSIDDARLVLERYGLSGDRLRNIQPLDNAGGWSGSRLWRASTRDGRELCLRRWPTEHPAGDRLRLIHDVLGRVYAGGLHIVPAPHRTTTGETFVRHDDHLWELTPWMPGRADFHERPTPVRLRAAMQTLARFHCLSSGAGADVSSGPAPAILERRELLEIHQIQHYSQLRAAIEGEAIPELDSRLRRLLQQLESRGPRLLERLTVAETVQTVLQPAIRDVHRDHVLFMGEEVTGLIDFGAMRVDTPLADVARLVGSLVGNEAERRQAAFAAYAEVRPLSNPDRALVDLLDESGLLLGGLNWIRWLAVERRDMGPPGPIGRRLDEMLARLAHLV